MPQDNEMTLKEVAGGLEVSYITALKYVHNKWLRAIWRGRWIIPREEYERFKREGIPKGGMNNEGTSPNERGN